DSLIRPSMEVLRGVRYSPESGHRPGALRCPLRAISSKRTGIGCSTDQLGCEPRAVSIEDLRDLFQTNAGVRGRIILISVNAPGCVSTSIVPACCFTTMS